MARYISSNPRRLANSRWQPAYRLVDVGPDERHSLPEHATDVDSNGYGPAVEVTLLDEPAHSSWEEAWKLGAKAGHAAVAPDESSCDSCPG